MSILRSPESQRHAAAALAAALALGAVGYALWCLNARSPARTARRDWTQRARPKDWDLVDEASAASFPASDPPGYSGLAI